MHTYRKHYSAAIPPGAERTTVTVKELLANKLSNWHDFCLVLEYGQDIPC